MTRRPVVTMTPLLAAMLADQERKDVPTRIDLPTAQTREALKSKADKKAESELQSQCEALLSMRGVRFRFHMANPRGNMEGVPDLLFVYRGVPCAVELKVKDGHFSADQDRVAEEMRLDGWHVREAWSLEQFRAILDQLENEGENR